MLCKFSKRFIIMDRCWKLFFIFVLVIALSTIAQGQLRPGGRNVCHRRVSYNAYENRRFTRIGYDNYRTCCKKIWGVCTSRCTRYRTKIVTYYNSVLVVRHRDTYFCCAGWAAAGSECTKPICAPACQNGNCVSPNKCSCKAGFQGKLCESDIDECVKKPCQQICNNLPGTYSCSCKKGFVHPSSDPKNPVCQDVNECNTKPCKCAPGSPSCGATCSNNVGSFTCSCGAGYKLIGGKTCTDINECAGAHGCAHRCLNNPGSYSCACNSGYVLASNKRGCNDINECSTLNGGCNQKCTNQPGTYFCSCNAGYKLQSNKKTCVDINECTIGTPCDKAHGICENLVGSYRCKCKIGYALQADKKTCKDINECSSPKLNACAHNCHNNDGSYTCTCKVGYRLATDKRGCNDINECTEKTHTCQHNCHNNVGSYTCSCRPGYKLEADGRKCKALPCQSISKPKNGQMKCTGFVTDESCTFTCDKGFNLFGSNKRMCLPTAVWSGVKTICKPKPCPKIQPPLHGSVLLPCIEEYNSTCLLKCSRGYYLAGQRAALCIVESGKTRWDLHNSTCKAVEACTPNPCNHGGRCSVLGIKEFSCNCDGTGYVGKRCENGVVQTPSYPQLFVKEKSVELVFKAFPDTEIRVTPVVDSSQAVFVPATVIITKTNNNGRFTVTAQKAGAIRVTYKLSGADAFSFNQPAADVIYARVKRNVTKPVSLKSDFYTKGCRTRGLGRCGGSSTLNTMTLSSTCNWASQTAGFVSVNGNGLKLPLSAVGMKTVTAGEIYRSGIVAPISETAAFLNNQVLPTCQSWGKCKDYEFDTDAVNFILSNNLFAEAYYRKFSSFSPFWLNTGVDTKVNSFSPSDVYATVGKGENLKKASYCSGFDFESGILYTIFSPKQASTLSLQSAAKMISSKTQKCFVVDVCKKLAHFITTKQHLIDLTSDFAAVGLGFVKMGAYRFGFGDFGKKCVNFGSSKDACVTSKSYWTATGSIDATAKSKVEFDGRFDVEFANIDDALIQKLTAKHKLRFEGSLVLDMEMKLLGSSLKVRHSDKQGLGFVQVGGTADSCPICTEHGIHLMVKGSEKMFDYGVSTLKLKPQEASVRVSILKDAFGGKVSGVENQNALSLLFRVLNTIGTMFSGLKLALGSKYPKDSAIIEERAKVLTGLVQKVTNITSQPSADFKTLYILIRQLQNANADLKPALDSLKQRLGSDPGSVKIKNSLRFLSFRLKQIQELSVTPKTDSMAVKSQGMILSYQGGICVHQLCFSSQRVSIYDITEDIDSNPNCKGCKNPGVKGLKKDRVLISAMATKDTQLGKKVRLRRGNQIKLHAARDKNVISGSFDGEINLFDQFYPATFKFSEKTFSFEAKNVKVSNGLTFDVSGSNDVKKVSWNDVVRNLKGVTTNTSMAVTELRKLSQMYFYQTGNSTGMRIRKSLDRQREANLAVEQQRKTILSAQANLKNSTEKLRAAKLAYQRQLVLLNRTQVELQSYMKDLGPLFIEKNLNNVCKFGDCKEKCVTMPVCKICQDPVKVDVDTVKCEQATEKIRTQHVESFMTKCELRKYQFIPIYTGSCAESPGMAAYRDQQLKQNLVATGAATGALIGSIVPGIGTVLGSAIGAVVGFVGGLFSSCDKSYEVYTKTWTVQVDCAQTRKFVKTVNRVFSECFYVKKNVLTGYKQPKECNCKTNPCITKIKEPACLIQNSKCQDLRAAFLKNTKKVPPKFTETYNKAQQLKNNVNSASINLRKIEKERAFYQQEYDRAIIFGKHKSHDSKIANQTQANVLSLLATENCILRHFRKSSDLSNHLTINSLSFDTSLPLIDNLRLDAQVKSTSKTSTGTIPFLLQLEDKDLSFVGAAKKIVRRELCNAARRRRSVNDIDHDDLPFTSWYVDASQNASSVQKACVTFKKTTEYLTHVFDNLYNLTVEGKLLARRIKHSRGSIGSSSNLFASAGGENSIVAAQKKELNSLASALDVAEGRTRPEEVLKQWKENSEVFTGLNNVTVCLNLKDCVDVTFDSLKKMPTMFKVNRQRYLYIVERAERLAEGTFEHSGSLDKLMSNARELLRVLRELKSVSLLCADPPKATISCDEEYVARKGEQVTMRCNARSMLPFKYIWKRGKEIIEGETRSILRFKAEPEMEGFYTCTVSSLAGSATTNGTLLKVEHAPAFTSEPNDTIYFNPSRGDVLTTFTCNVTATPKAAIQWYYLPFSGPQVPRQVYNVKSSLLVFVRPGKANAGFYFCRASNKYGLIESRKARLDVLDIMAANQSLTFSFDVTGTVGNLTADSFRNLSRRMKVDRQIQVTVEYVEESSTRGYLAFTSYVVPNITVSNSSELLLAAASKARQALANSVATLLGDILLSRSAIKTADGRSLVADNETMKTEFFGNICKDGYRPKEDGFMCVECPSGTYEQNNKCLPCKIGYYQEKTGQVECTSCDTGELTEKKGSANRLACINPRESNVDMIFIVDSSRSISYGEWRRIKHLLLRFTDHFAVNSSVRVGIITFAHRVFLDVELGSYKDKKELQTTIQMLRLEGGWTRTYDAMAEARVMFRRRGRKNSKKIAVVLSDGKSSEYRRIPGFFLVRDESFNLRADGIHVTSIGVGRNIDKQELLAIASYPKENNTFMMRRAYKTLPNATEAIIGRVYLGNCFRPSSVDIGILATPFQTYGDLHRANGFLKSLLVNAYSALNTTTVNTAFFNVFSHWGHPGFFEKYRTMHRLRRHVELYVSRPVYYFDMRFALNDVVGARFNEWNGSSSRLKILLVVTKNRLNPGLIRDVIREHRNERVLIWNVMTRNRPNPSGEMVAFHTDDAKQVLSRIKSLVNKKYCEP